MTELSQSNDSSTTGLHCFQNYNLTWRRIFQKTSKRSESEAIISVKITWPNAVSPSGNAMECTGRKSSRKSWRKSPKSRGREFLEKIKTYKVWAKPSVHIFGFYYSSWDCGLIKTLKYFVVIGPLKKLHQKHELKTEIWNKNRVSQITRNKLTSLKAFLLNSN